MDDFPVPLRFELPGPPWRAVRPDAVGIRNARFAALREDTPGDFTPVLSISGGWRTDEATMEQIADEAVDRLRDETGEARLITRQAAGGPRTPSYSQVIAATAEIDGVRHVLTRLQALIGLVDAEDDRRRAVLIVSCTSLTAQVDLVAPEFQRLVAGLRVDGAERPTPDRSDRRR